MRNSQEAFVRSVYAENADRSRLLERRARRVARKIGARPVGPLELELHGENVDLGALAKETDFVNNRSGAEAALRAKIPPGDPYIERIEPRGEQVLVQRIEDDGTPVGDLMQWDGSPLLTEEEYSEYVKGELARALVGETY